MKKRDPPTGIKGCTSHVGAGSTTKGCASHVGAGSTFCPGWCYQPGQKVIFCPGCQTRDKRAPLLSRTGVPSWETGTTGVSQPGQINVFVVVNLLYHASICVSPLYPFVTSRDIQVIYSCISIHAVQFFFLNCRK